MGELITRMPNRHRVNLLKLRQHRVNEFSKVLEKRILKYFNELFERNKKPKAFKERHEHEKLYQEQQRKQIAAVKDAAQSIANHNSNTVFSGAALTAGLVGSAAETYQSSNIARLELNEAREQLKAAQVDIYFPQHRATIIKSVVNILSYHFQFLILRLNGGNNGYIKLANFMGDAIEGLSLDKLRQDPNQINCLVDAAIPKSNSRRYYTFAPSLSKPWLYKTLEIDMDTNNLIDRCGPAVQALLGTSQKLPYYNLRDVLNFSLIINARGEIIKTATKKENQHQLLNSANPYPVILIGPNETSTDVGLEHGTTPETYTIQSLQLNALQRLVPDFFSEEMNHDINVTVDRSNENPAEMVHIEERDEYEWTIERKQLWLRRQAVIQFATKNLQKLTQACMEQDIHGIAAKKAANLFDAQQAEIDVNKMLQQSEQVLDELNIIRESDSHEETIANQKLLKEQLSNKIYYLILSVKQLIISAQKLESKDENKKKYFILAIKALKNAKHNMQAIRENPINEYAIKEELENLTQKKKNIFKLWQKHLYYCNLALDITTHASAPLQLPHAIRKFVFDMDSKASKSIEELMTQASIQAAHTNLLMEQMSILNKYTTFDLTTNTFPKQKRIHSKKYSLMKIPQVSTHFLGEKPQKDQDSEEKSDDSTEHFTFKEIKKRFSGTSALTLGQIHFMPTRGMDQANRSSSTNHGIEFTSIKDDEHEEVRSNSSVTPDHNVSDIGEEAQSIEFFAMIKNAFHVLTVNKYNKIESRLDKIEICTDGIRRFKNGIFSSLGIDEFDIELNEAYLNGVEKKLSEYQLLIATKSETTYLQALENKNLAFSNRRRAMMKWPVAAKKTNSRQTIKRCEIKSTEQIKMIIDSQNMLDQKFLKDKSTSSRILSVFQRFQNIIMPNLSLIQLKSTEEWQEYIEKINSTAIKNENEIDQNHLKDMEQAYDKMLKKLKELPGEKASTLNEALEYAQIIKNCNRKVIHSSNGDRTASASSNTMIKHLDGDVKKIVFEINNTKKVLINLTRDCQTTTDNSNSIRKNQVILKTSEAFKEIQSFIETLGNHSSSPRPKSRLLRCDSTLGQENSSEDIKSQLFDKVDELIAQATESWPQQQSQLLSNVQQELTENSKLINKNYGYLNWGVWIISIAARTCVLFHREQLNLSEEKLELSPITSINDKVNDEGISQSMLASRKLLLEVYQQLDHAMQNPPKDIDETLTNEEELILDELQWASQLNIDEIQERERIKAQENKAKKNKIQSTIPTQSTYNSLVKSTKEKLNPNKSIYYQLLIYSILFVRNKQNIIQKLNSYRTQLRKDHHYFSHMVKDKKKHAHLVHDIHSLYKSIDSKVIKEQKEKKNINQLEKNLTSRRVVLQIFFQDWKDKTRDLFPSNSLLSALKEASKIKSKHKLRLIEEKAQEDEEQREEDGYEILPNAIEELSLENIDELFMQIQQRIITAKASHINLCQPNALDDSSDSDSISSINSRTSFLSTDSSSVSSKQKMPVRKSVPCQNKRVPQFEQSNSRFFKLESAPTLKVSHKKKIKTGAEEDGNIMSLGSESALAQI